MGERYLQWVYPGEVPDYERADPAEVLAELGGERMWYCYSLGSVRYSPRPQCTIGERCGWVWIVKEAVDG